MKSNALAIILIIASLGLFFSYTNKKYAGISNSSVFAEKTIKELQEDELRYSEALNKTLEIRQRIDNLLDVYNSVPESTKEELKKLLPDHVDSVRLVIDISEVATVHNVTIEDVDISFDKKGVIVEKNNNTAAVDFSSDTSGPIVSSGGSRRVARESVDLGFSVAGKYEDFKNFITSLEKSLRVVDVTSISFKSENNGVYIYDVKIKTYLLKQV